MSKISNRSSKLGLSPTRAFEEILKTCEANETEVIKLNIGQPDIDTPPEFWDFLADGKPKLVSYTPSAGMTELRELIAQDYASYGVPDLAGGDVVITAGASEAIYFALQVCLDHDDELLIPTPFYANYNSIATINRNKIVPIITDIEKDFALPNIDEIAELITEKTKAIFIINPDNPTGKIYTESELTELVELTEEKGLWLIVDEVYKDFIFNNSKFVSALSFGKDHVVVIDSISKKFSACGARIGAIISKNAEFIATTIKYAQSRLSAGMIDQLAAISLYKANLKSFLETEIREKYKSRKITIEKELAKIPGVKVPKVDGAFYLFIKLPVENTWDFSKWMLTDYPRLSGRNETILMAPGNGFYTSQELGHQFVRIAYVLEEEKLIRACNILKVGLEMYNLLNSK